LIASDGSTINAIGADNPIQQGNENLPDIADIEDENLYVNSVIPVTDFESFVNRKEGNMKNLSREFKVRKY